MTFSVNTNALLGYADMMDRRWHDFETGRGYLKENTSITIVTAGVLNDIAGQHQKIVAEIDDFLSRAAGFAGGMSTAVVEADQSYLHADLATVRRMDAALPTVTGNGPGNTTLDPSLPPEVFGDPICPAARFQPPPDHRRNYPMEWSYFDVTSPVATARDIIWKATSILAGAGALRHPVDITDAIVIPLCGDWARYVTCADVYENIALALADDATCVNDGADTLSRVWAGHAADLCAQRSRWFAASLHATTNPLRHIAGIYREIAEHVRTNAEIAAMEIMLIADLLVEAVGDACTDGFAELVEWPEHVRNLIKVYKMIPPIIELVRETAEAAIERMDEGISVLTALGIIRDETMMPGTPSVPSLPVHSSARFE